MVDRLEKPKRKRTKTLLRQCDELCGKIVRSRGRCVNCGAAGGLQWAHGFSRSYRKIRHDLRNGFCLCSVCHMRYTHNPLLWDLWLHDRWGDDLYVEMRDLALHGPKADLKVTLALLELVAAEIGLD